MKIAIIGGGASGLACACELIRLARKNGLRPEVCIFEKNDRVGKKLLSTGNGRCNMLNLHASAEDYYEAAPFVSHALEKFPAKSNITFFETLGLYTHADEEGRVYPLSNQASGVLDVLRFYCEKAGVKIYTSTPVQKIEKRADKFVINGKSDFDFAVLSVGSKAAVKDYFGYELLRQLSHKVTKVAPSLVKLSTTANETKQLKGIRASVELKLNCGGNTVAKEKGEILFAENVLSGIVSMQLSPYASRFFMGGGERAIVYADFVPSFEFNELQNKISAIIKNNPYGEAQNLLIGFVPKKIGEVILKKCGISFAAELATLGTKEIKHITSLCKSYPFEINGVKSFSEAQVVAGGADLSLFNSKTLESKKVRGLYCCGEVLDVDGPCGGYNLGWAWSSGRLCANSIINQITQKGKGQKYDKN